MTWNDLTKEEQDEYMEKAMLTIECKNAKSKRDVELQAKRIFLNEQKRGLYAR